MSGTPQPVVQVQTTVPPAPPAFRKTARTSIEVAGLTATVRAEDRQKMTATEREKLHVAAVSGLIAKFGLLSMSDDKAQLQNTYNVTMRIHEFFEKLTKFDMQGQFLQVVTPNPADPTTTLAGKVNVLEEYPTLGTAEVRTSNKYYKEYGPDHMIQNLLWSQELLENSCETALRDKVTEQLLDVPSIEQGGPLFFLMMIKVITSTTEEATRAMIRKLTTMKISDLQGENVDKAISNVRIALTRLRTVNQVPNDIKKLLIELFQTTSVPGFNEVFKTLDNTMRLGLASGPLFDEGRIIDLAETTYHEFNERGEWTSAKSSGGIFTVCWNCQEEGHVRSECPKLRVQQPNNEGSRGGGRYGRGRNGRFGRHQGNGRGRSGRGRVGGQRGGRYQDDGRGRAGGRGEFGRGEGRGRGGSTDAMARPPQVRGQTEQNFNGVAHSWCHWCARWVSDHGTHTHAQHFNSVPIAPPATPQVTPHTTFVVPPSPQAQFASAFQGMQLDMSGKE